MMRWQFNRVRFGAGALAVCSGILLAVGCGFSSDVSFGEEGQPFDPLDPLGTGSGGSGQGSSGKPGASSGGGGSSGAAPLPETCVDGQRNGGETDIDCGVACAAPCGVSKQCAVSEDCGSKVCTSGRCQPPTGTDGVQNGDESGLDCGGTTTGAARCAVGQTCAVNADCETRGCSNGLCIEAPSCAVQFGGTTCGAGEVGSGAEQHESCCTSIEVPGFSDPARPGKRVFLDKYEITAGRMRAFVAAMTQQFGGQPNINAFISAAPPPRWQPGWTTFMATGTDGLMANTPNGGAHGTGSGCGASCNVGTNYLFGAALYQYSHGHNCYHGAGNSFGFSTYWYPDDVMRNQNGGEPRIYSQDVLDTKALNCTPSAVYAAFCHWDGGQLATVEVMNTVATNLAASGNTSSDGSQVGSYPVFPAFNTSTDVANRVAAPGRMVADATTYNGAGPWMDLRGNLNETMLSGSAFVIELPFGGLGQGSLHAGGNDDAWLSHPEQKSGMQGARCMRFKN